MDNSEAWRDYFRRWPAGLNPTGIIVTSFSEQIVFENFQCTADLLLVDRRVPDTLGARRVVVPFSEIMAVKITDVVAGKALKDFGFEPPPSRAAAKQALATADH